jgi:hypothetical protein
MKARHIILLSGLLWIWPIFFVAGDPSRDTPPPTQDKLLSLGDILIVQQHLTDLHFNPGPVDGVWHPETTAALMVPPAPAEVKQVFLKSRVRQADEFFRPTGPPYRWWTR